MYKELFKNEEMYCLVAPDGTPQLSVCGGDFPECVGYLKLMHSKGLSKSFHELCVVGKFKILPVKVTVIQTGDENTPFNKKP
jgi:hypothetical protein